MVLKRIVARMENPATGNAKRGESTTEEAAQTPSKGPRKEGKSQMKEHPKPLPRRPRSNPRQARRPIPHLKRAIWSTSEGKSPSTAARNEARIPTMEEHPRPLTRRHDRFRVAPNAHPPNATSLTVEHDRSKKGRQQAIDRVEPSSTGDPNFHKGRHIKAETAEQHWEFEIGGGVRPRGQGRGGGGAEPIFLTKILTEPSEGLIEHRDPLPTRRRFQPPLSDGVEKDRCKFGKPCNRKCCARGIQYRRGRSNALEMTMQGESIPNVREPKTAPATTTFESTTSQTPNPSPQECHLEHE